MRTMLIGAVMLLACPIITLIAGGWCASVSCADDKGDKTSEQAKAICEKFNKANWSQRPGSTITLRKEKALSARMPLRSRSTSKSKSKQLGKKT